MTKPAGAHVTLPVVVVPFRAPGEHIVVAPPGTYHIFTRLFFQPPAEGGKLASTGNGTDRSSATEKTKKKNNRRNKRETKYPPKNIYMVPGTCVCHIYNSRWHVCTYLEANTIKADNTSAIGIAQLHVCLHKSVGTKGTHGVHTHSTIDTPGLLPSPPLDTMASIRKLQKHQHLFRKSSINLKQPISQSQPGKVLSYQAIVGREGAKTI